MRTSQSHPLRIDELPLPGGGRIGLTFCPGKHQDDALTGAWRRDLELDLDAVVDWGAAAVVTLVTATELVELNVANLGPAVQARGLQWLHLPIEDAQTPTAEWMVAWRVASPGLHAILDDGGKVLVHCKGGLGRAGTVAGLLLVEAGVSPDEAVLRVRSARPGAIETRGQLAIVRRHNRR